MEVGVEEGAEDEFFDGLANGAHLLWRMSSFASIVAAGVASID